jgi:HK97 family phage portal protein
MFQARRRQPKSAIRTDSEQVTRLEVPKFLIPERRANAAPVETRSADTLQGKLSLILSQDNGAGVTITENTAANVAAVTACVGLLSDMIALLPCKLYRKSTAGREEVTDHPSARVMQSPGDLHTSFELRQLMETGKGFGGNGYARVHRAGDGDPQELEWLKPCDVNPQRRAGHRHITYQIQGERNPLTRYDVLHVRGFTMDGVKGCSPIHLLRNAIGTSYAQSQAAGNLIRNGTVFPGYLTSPASLTKTQIEDARSEWEKTLVHGNNKGKMPILWGDWDFKQTNGMTMVDAQFLESRRFELQEIARLYRIPSFLIGDTTASTTWGSGIEQQNLGFLSYSLNPHLVAWEQSLDYTLLTEIEKREGYYFKFNRAALMQVALQAQAEFFTKMRGIGVLNVNEIRNLMELNDLENAEIGEDYTLPLNNTGGAQSSATPTETTPTT